MVATSRGLIVALSAAVLLILVVGVDASMTRTVELQVEDGDGWRTIGTTGEDHPPRLDHAAVEKNRSDEVAFRLTVDNGYAWAYDEAFTVHAMGPQVASGTLTADARGQGEATFQVPVSSLLGQGDRPMREPWPVNLETNVGSDWIYASLQIREVAS